MDDNGGSTGEVSRRAGLVALGTLASRVLGMLRESVIAASFSIVQTDAFFIAFTIPNTLRMLLGEGAVANAFIPVFSGVRTRSGDAASRQFLSRFAGALGSLLLLTTVVGMLAAPLLAALYAGGYLDDPERFALVTTLTRWLFPFLLLTGLSALATGALNVRGRFGVSAFAPALLNVAMIAAPFVFLPFTSALQLPAIMALALGALVGGLLQLGVQLPSLRSLGLLVRPQRGLRDPEVRRALSLMVPLVFGLGVYQINMLLSRLFASLMPVGSQSYLNYGQRVIEIPQGMFALALASATLPAFARLRSEHKQDELLTLFRYSLRLTLFIAIPSSVALFVLAAPICAVLFGRGAFEPVHVIETARSLAYQAAGVWAVAGVRAVVPMFSAHEDTRAPVRASTVNLLVFLATTMALMSTLNHVAIAIGNSVAAVVQLGVLLWALRKKLGPLGLSEVVASAARTCLAAAGMGVVAWTAARTLPWTQTSELTRAGALVLVTLAGVLAFFVMCLLLRSPELLELKRAVQRRGKRAT